MFEFLYRDEHGNVGIFEDDKPYSLCFEMGWEFLRIVEEG